MISLKNYFLTQNKMFWLLPLAILILTFYIHYVIIMGYEIDFFRNANSQTREEILNGEIAIYKINFFMNLLVYISQVVFVTIGLNIGLLFFEYEKSLQEIGSLVIKSSIALILIYLISPLLLLYSDEALSFEKLYNIESDFTLSRFIEKDSPIWLKNVLEMFSFSQLIFVLTLSLGFKYLMGWTYNKSLIWVLKIYGILFILWVGFAIIMDLNFYQ